MDNPLQTSVSPRESLRQSIDGYQLSQCLYVAARLGIADLLKDGPKHYDALAKESGAKPNALFRLLRTLAAAGVFAQLQGEQFGLNQMSGYLCRDSPGSLRAWAILSGEQPYPAWGHLLHSVTTGEAAFDHLHGMSEWQYRAQDPSAARVFNEAMSENVRAGIAAILEAYDFSQFGRIVDVGGGQGALLAGILRANPPVRGVLFDLERVVQSAKESLKEAGVSERCELVGGSFLEEVPGGGDAYIIKDVLLDWEDGEVAQILRNCRKVMKENQALLIIERVIASGKPTLDAALVDMRMMVMNGGRTRTVEEFRALLSTAGFEFVRSVPTRSPYLILEGRPVQ